LIILLLYVTTGPNPIKNVLQYQRNATITLMKRFIYKAVAWTRMTVHNILFCTLKVIC